MGGYTGPATHRPVTVMASSADLVLSLRKAYGDGTIKVASQKQIISRIPTGIFPLDIAIGGGIPMGKFSVVYGQESSNKTNITLKTIARSQVLYPKLAHVFVDVEHSFDADWARLLGVDVDELILVQPTHGEQAVEIVDKLLATDDLHLLVLDSLAMLNPLSQLNNDVATANVGGNTQLIQKMVSRIIHRQAEAAMEGLYPTVFAINQIRYKIGVMFGNPEKQPGGKAMEHASGLTLRTYAKSLSDKEVHDSLPSHKETTVTVAKHKVPITSVSAKFKMEMIGSAKTVPGRIDDWNSLSAWLKDLGWAKKKEKGSGWHLLDQEFSTIKAMREHLDGNTALDQNIRDAVIAEALKGLYA